ncbi:DUF349 domain-containing protein [Actinomyces minihominis]|uniref:DUF349 domain-containing protein n=1 Tax=Actinomyces minihominis TaxID=2002838 RepID=UPI001F5CAB41|nr:DUF349 domain-containing protein [Actinomyces minihominis]
MTEQAKPQVPEANQPAAEKNEPQPVLTVDFGYTDAAGNVWVKDGETDRIIGAYPDGLPEDPFALYTRRFEDLVATANLFEARMPQLTSRDLDSTLKSLREQVQMPSAIGDLPALRARVEEFGKQVAERKEALRIERAAAKETMLAERTALVDEAEAIAAQPAERTQWKNSGARLRELLDQWKHLQQQGPRLDKADEDALWKRFSAARTTFDRGRRQYFSALDQRQSDTKATKERLIAEAEALQNSTAWRDTAAKYRDLMAQWKQAGRASRKEDDALWARFRAAQQVFFDSRRSFEAAVDEEFGANLVLKEELALQAEALLPITDIPATKKALGDIQEKWESIGQVPSRDLGRIEGRLRAVERELREAEQKEWQKSNPETRARAGSMLAQLEASIAELTATKAAAEAAGDKKLAEETDSALKVKVLWLEQIQSSIE